VLVEFLDVLLCRADKAETELVGMCARSREMWWDGDGKDFAMGKVDELCCDGCKGDAESDVVDVVEGDGTGGAVAVARVGPMDGEERVGRLRKVAREGKGVVDVRSEVCGVLGNGEERGRGHGETSLRGRA